MPNLKKFTSVHDVPNLENAIKECLRIKNNPLATPAVGKTKTVGLIFMNPSLRTRISMQQACRNLGFNSIVVNAGNGVWTWELEDGVVMDGTTVEHIKDAAKVLNEYCDILAVRCFPSLTNKEEDAQDKILNKFIEHTTVPVISMESATRHPLQSLTDMMTIRENWKKDRKPKVVLTWAPHVKPIAHSVANSFAEWIGEYDAETTIAYPEGYDLNPEFTEGLTLTHNQDEALKDADFVYVKNWSSYEDYGATPKVEEDWLLTLDKLKQTNNAKIMHCLPVRRNVEVSDEVLDSENSLIYQQAGNRLISAQWVLKNMLSDQADN